MVEQDAVDPSSRPANRYDAGPGADAAALEFRANSLTHQVSLLRHQVKHLTLAAAEARRLKESAEVAQLRAERDLFLQSRSWRITAPLRLLKTAIAGALRSMRT